MKFICNNCGFSAEIPEKRPNCPMCASSNVTVKDESAADEKKEEQSSKSEIGESAEEVVTRSSDAPGEKKKKVRSEKITLTDNFFDQKPNREDQEIADVLKELYPDEESKSGNMKLPYWRILAGVGAAVVTLVIVVAFSVFPKDESEDVAKDLVEIEEEVEEAEEVVEKETAEIVKEPQEENDPEDIKEKGEVAQQDPEEELEVREQEKKVVEVEKKAPRVVKKRKNRPKKKIAARKKAKPKPVKKASSTNRYNEYVQLGHVALGQKKYTDALHEYKNAMRIKPRNGKVYKFIGIAYAYLGNQAQACENYRKYIQLTPNAKDKAQVQAFLEACP